MVAGLALYGLGAMVWLYVLARLPLSAAYPFVGLGFILTMVLGSVAPVSYTHLDVYKRQPPIPMTPRVC